jgi:hypothetical protein
VCVPVVKLNKTRGRADADLHCTCRMLPPGGAVWKPPLLPCSAAMAARRRAGLLVVVELSTGGRGPPGSPSPSGGAVPEPVCVCVCVVAAAPFLAAIRRDS